MSRGRRSVNFGVEILSFPETLQFRRDQRFRRAIFDIDRKVFGELSARDAGCETQWAQVTEHRPDSYIVAVDARSRTPVAYLDIFPLTKLASSQIKQGALGDGELCAEDVVGMQGQVSSLYVMTVAVAPEWQRLGLARSLWSRAVRYWTTFAPAETFATIWSPSGRRFFSSLQTSVIGRDPHGHETISLRLADLDAEVICHPEDRPMMLQPALSAA